MRCQLTIMRSKLELCEKLFYYYYSSVVESSFHRIHNKMFNAFNYQTFLIFCDVRQYWHSGHLFSVNPRYLQEEWKIKMGSPQSFEKEMIRGWSPLVPQQDNYTDCGIYVLQYVESFLKVFSLWRNWWASIFF